MPWTYKQKTGELLRPDGSLQTGLAFAGQPPWLNNPDGWRVLGKGPLPCGLYKIGPAYNHPEKGPVCMNLTPDVANDMAGRSLFRIHGWSASDKDHSSEGCICAPRADREAIDKSDDKLLQVVRGD